MLSFTHSLGLWSCAKVRTLQAFISMRRQLSNNFRWDGQVTVYFPDQGCYRCIHPNPPNPSAVTNCSEGGVIGAVCGVIGSIQATETLKILANTSPEDRNYSLKGKMILYDGLRGDMRTIRLRGKQTGCKLCGTREITKLIGKALLCHIHHSTRIKCHLKTSSSLRL